MKMLIAAVAVAAMAVSPAMANPKHHAKHARHHAASVRAHADNGCAANAQGTANAYGCNAMATVVERDPRGRAIKVMVDGREYVVCTAMIMDSCINPRQAGLNFGNVPLDTWPGRPASEMH